MAIKIAICGMACSGKTTVAKLIVDYFNGGAAVVKFADPIYTAIKALGQPKHRGFMQEFGDLAKRHFGTEIFAEIVTEKVKEIESTQPFTEAIICDDLRFPFEFDTAKRAGFKTIFVSAGFFARWRRAEASGIPLNSGHNSETSVSLISGKCDYVVNNEGGVEALERAIRSLLDHIIEEAAAA